MSSSMLGDGLSSQQSSQPSPQQQYLALKQILVADREEQISWVDRLECGFRSSSSCFRDFACSCGLEMRACLQKSNAKSRCQRTYRLEFRELKQQKLKTLRSIGAFALAIQQS